MDQVSQDSLVTLKKRAEFLRVRGGRRYSTGAFVVEAKSRGSLSVKRCTGRGAPGADSELAPTIVGPRFGFTVTKKVGNAVQRNRIRRRLKSAVRSVLKQRHIGTDADVVIIARQRAGSVDFSTLCLDLDRGIAAVAGKQ